jgi:dienelactone hydrolase
MNRRQMFRLFPGMATANAAAAQTSDPPAYLTILEEKAVEIMSRTEAELASKEAWEPLRRRRRQELQDMLGLEPWPQRTDLRPRVTGRLDYEDYVVERVAFESVPKCYVTANLYLPKKTDGPAPGIVYVCGHAGPAQGSKVAYQRHGISFARNGYACLILDTIQIGEIYSVHHGVYGLRHWDWYSRGYTPAGIETWNAILALDYLETRPEVDKQRMGMTGRSGGAAMTWFTAALDDRIRVAAPIMGNSTYVANLHENTQKGHCDCMFPLNFHRQEMAHQGALIAPRPLLMAHGRKDSLFPVAGFSKFEELMNGLYASYGKPERFRNIVVDTGHADSDYLREEAIGWFDTHLMGKPGRKLEMRYTNAEPQALAVFQGHPPKDAINPKIDLVFRPAASPVIPANRAAWLKRSGELTGLLRKRVFTTINDGRSQWTRQGNSHALVYVVPHGEEAAVTSNFFRFAGFPKDATRMLVYPQFTTNRDTLRNAMHVGTSPDRLRVEEVLRVVRGMRAAHVLVAGRGTDAGVALYAALLEPRIGGVLMIEPPESHWEGPVFLNVLRYTDLPEAAGLLAPRPLHFFHRMPPAYEFTAKIYEMMGAREAIGECYSLEAAINALSSSRCNTAPSRCV